MLFTYAEGATPLTLDEIRNLIPLHLTTQKQLNEWEQHNILQAEQWAFSGRKNSIMTTTFLRKLHRKMFDKTWKWAGQFRIYQTNIGCESAYIQQELGLAFNDAAYQMQMKVYSLREACVRLHHRIVLIHPFPNGNGRLARLFVDLILVSNKEPKFSWGSGGNLKEMGEARSTYLTALREADKGDYSKLIIFTDS
jgi:Fic-DOC domain mobile mystery protein B